MAKKSAATLLQAARQAHGLTQAQVIDALLRRAARLNIPTAGRGSLSTMLSRWENGRDQVTDPGYRRLFREILGRTNIELGFPDEPPDESTDELRSRLATARTVDAETCRLLQHEIDTIRHLDRRFGAATVLDQLMTQLGQIERLLAASPETPQRAALSDTLADAATLAGWEALDRGALDRAWRLHETAKHAAREAGSPTRLAYAIGQQSYVLLDLGQTDHAVEQLAHARSLGAHAPALLRTWLAAAHGEALAASGDRDGALAAFDTARADLPAETIDGAMPYLLLSDGHLDRWRGHALTRPGDAQAVELLDRTLAELTGNTARGRVGTLTDLAFAHAVAGDRDAALAYSGQAHRLAAQIGSDRQRVRLAALVLPVPRRSRR